MWPLSQVSDSPSASHDSKIASLSKRIVPIDGSSMGAELNLIFASTKLPLSVLRTANASSCVRFIAPKNATSLAENSIHYPSRTSTKHADSPPRHPSITVVDCHSHQRTPDEKSDGPTMSRREPATSTNTPLRRKRRPSQIAPLETTSAGKHEVRLECR